MSPDVRPEFARGGLPPFSAFLECDSARRVVWTSERLGQSGVAGDLGPLLVNLASSISDQIRASGTIDFRFTRLLKLQNSVVVRIQLLAGETQDGSRELAGMLALVRNMVQNIVHLQTIHIRLSAQVARRNRGDGRKALQLLEMERARLGSELHTGVGQQLTAIGFQLDIIERASTPLSGPVQDALRKIRTLTLQAHDQARSLSHLLYPPEYGRLTVHDLLTQLWDLSGIPETFGANAELRLAPLSQEPYLTAKRLIYRTAQESLQNVMRHSQATRVTMTLDEAGARYRLAIEDNGKGVELDSILQGATSLSKGIGLRSIREQVYANGGDCRVVSGPGLTKIEVSLPVQEPGEV